MSLLKWRRVTLAYPCYFRAAAGEVNHRRCFHAAETTVNNQVQLVLERIANVFRIGHWLGFAGKYQRAAHDGFAQLSQKCMHNRVVRNTYANSAALGVQQTPWHFASGVQNEGVSTGCVGFKKAVGGIVNLGVSANV